MLIEILYQNLNMTMKIIVIFHQVFLLNIAILLSLTMSHNLHNEAERHLKPFAQISSAPIPSSLKLPSLFATQLFWTFHIKSHNMETFLPLTCLYAKNNFCPWGLLEYFLEIKLLPDYPCKSHDHDHQWVDLVMAWLP